MAESPERPSKLEELELSLLLEAVFRQSGYDFRNYAASSMLRRVHGCVRNERVATISALQERALHDPGCMERLVLGLTVQVSSMFRDPAFYLAIRRKVVPLLRTYPTVRIWHAGCAGGEEVFSLAILLEEEGLYAKCRIYATDLSEAVLARARQGSFRLAWMREYTRNYQQAGGHTAFSDYYAAEGDHARFRSSLLDHVTFAQHNLVTDESFNEFHLILCRNVMIYFDRALQERVFGLLYRSLPPLGMLGLGHKESLRLSAHAACFEELDAAERLYRKLR